jgi:hypothetical protein
MDVNNNNFIMVRAEELKDMRSALEELTLAVQKLSEERHVLSLDHLSEKQAMELLGKGKSWFHEMKKSGSLNHVKIGRTVYYRKEDIRSLFDGND